MGQRRIAFTSEEALLLTVDRGSVIAYEPVDGSIKWTFSIPKGNIVSIVYASTTALPSEVAAGPWRSPSSASTAVALDGDGVLHALDAVLGRELGTVAHEGEPVTLASGGDALAVAFEDRVLLYRAGAKHEIRKKASALAFSRDGLTLAIGTARGELFFFDVGTHAIEAFEPPVGGTISNVVPRPGGGWLVASERGLTAVYEQKNEKQLNGMVTGAAVDPAGKRLAVHRSEANVVLYDWPPTVPVGRISATGGTIHDIAFGPDDKIGVAMAGGGAAMVDPTTYEVRRTAQRPDEPRAVWLVAGESEAQRTARTEEQTRRAEAHEQRSGVGARLGIGGMVSLALIVIRIFLVGARASTPAWTPPPNFGNLPSYGTCDHSCEVYRLTSLEGECRRTNKIDCVKTSQAALEAFNRDDCTKTRALLDEIERANRDADGGGDVLVDTNRLLATMGLTTACRTTKISTPRHVLVRMSAPSFDGEVDDSVALEIGDTHALWASSDGVLFLATKKVGGTCEVRHQAKRDAEWTLDLENEECSRAALFGRSGREVYVSFGHAVRRFDGTAWGARVEIAGTIDSLGGTTAPGSDVFAVVATIDNYTLQRIHGKTFTEAKPVATDGTARELFSGPSLWAYGETATTNDLVLRWNGKDWSRRAGMADAGKFRTFMHLWQSPGGHLFAARDGNVMRSTNDGATWTETELTSPATRVWGRSNTDVYASGYSGVQHFDGTSWTSVYASPVLAITGDAKDVFVIATR